VGLTELAHVAAQNLPYGDLRRLELARALALGPRLLLLDEPAAGLDTAESHELGAALRRMRDEWGISIFMVEHDLELVRAVAEEAFVLDFGVILGGGDIRSVLEDPAVVEAYLGKAKGEIVQVEEALLDGQGATGA
jgi:branched-chain amino acid transport system ATP-binding protein